MPTSALPPGGLGRFTVAEIVETTSEGTPSRKKREHFGGTIPWVKSGELTGEHTRQIYELYHDWRAKDGLSSIITEEEAARNDYSLSTSRYVTTGGEPALRWSRGDANSRRHAFALLHPSC